MYEEHQTEAGVAADLARDVAEVQYLEYAQSEDVAVVVVPEKARLETLDLRAYHPRPNRKRGMVRVTQPASLVGYVTAHREAGTAIYADVEHGVVEAVINGHEPRWVAGASAMTDATPATTDAELERMASNPVSHPGWGDHRVTLRLRPSREWVEWTGSDGEPMAQVEFAHWVEDHLPDIVEPAGSVLLDLANSFEASSSAEFKGGQRLQSGETQLRYEETVEAKAGQRGDIRIPDGFQLALRPYEGMPAFKVDARFRYRVNGGQLRLWYQLARPDRVLDAAFDEVAEDVEAASGLSVYRGTAPGALQ